MREGLCMVLRRRSGRGRVRLQHGPRMGHADARAREEYVEGVLVRSAYAGYDQLSQGARGRRAHGMPRARAPQGVRSEGPGPRASVDPPRALPPAHDVEEKIRTAPCVIEARRPALALAMRREESVEKVINQIKEHVERYKAEVLPREPDGQGGRLLRRPGRRYPVAVPRRRSDPHRQQPVGAANPPDRDRERATWTFIGSGDAGTWAARLYGLMGTSRVQGCRPVRLAPGHARARPRPSARTGWPSLAPRLWKLARAPASVAA